MAWSTKKAVMAGAAAIAFGLLAASTAIGASEKPLFISIGEDSKPPIGWLQFCNDYAPECNVTPAPARDVVLSSKAWSDLVQVNKWVNDRIKPLTDMDHWGVVEQWNYPEDGYGDCEDYVLLKRKMLIKAGWPRSALLITVVRDKKNEGHAVLTVKTDKGEFVLDNQNENVVLWSESGYRFVKRQSQTDANAWVSLGDPPSTAATATARR